MTKPTEADPSHHESAQQVMNEIRAWQIEGASDDTRRLHWLATRAANWVQSLVEQEALNCQAIAEARKAGEAAGRKAALEEAAAMRLPPAMPSLKMFSKDDTPLTGYLLGFGDGAAGYRATIHSLLAKEERGDGADKIGFEP